MITAVFRQKNQRFHSVRMGGHAGYADAGEDIVCAAVTSAFQMCANGITEILHEPADVTAKDGTAVLTLSETPSDAAVSFIEALHLHLDILCGQYPRHIEITVSEVL